MPAIANAEPTPSEPDAPRWVRPAGMAAMALLPLVTLAWCLNHESISQRESHGGRMWLAAAGAALVLVYFLLARFDFGLGRKKLFVPLRAFSAVRFFVGRLFASVLVAAALFGVFNYYQYDKKVIGTAGDYNDATYYYLNSKYFAELGYYRLYEAMLIADDEARGRFRKVRRYRDLVGYKKYFPRKHAIDRADEVKAHFTEARWQQFVHDVEWITGQNPRSKWDYFFHDHGYNPPPSWTLVGGTLARICPVEHIKWITMVDFALIAVVMLSIAWAFGGPTALFALLWFIVTFSGRWPILGQSLLRFDWVSALVIAVCMLKKGKHGWAGALLTYSALNRVFPAVFGFPYVVWMLSRAWDNKKRGERLLSDDHLRFLIGVGASLLVFAVGALVVVGPEAFVQSAENLSMHGGPDSYSSHRVGLGDALAYRGEVSHSDVSSSGGIDAKIKLLWEMHTALRIFGVLSILGIAVYVWRSRREVWQHIWLGIYPLFIMTTPQINYYNLRLLLVILHMELARRVHPFLLSGLFIIEVVTQWRMVERAARYTVTTTTSMGLCAYLSLMVGWLIWDSVKDRNPSRTTP